MDNRTVMEKIKDELIPSLASGAVGAIASSFFLGVDLTMKLNVANMNLPAWAAIGGTITAADMIAYFSKDFVLEKIPVLKNYGGLEEMILPPALTGAATFMLFKTAISSDVSLTNSLLLGGGSSIAGRYAAETLHTIEPNYL